MQDTELYPHKIRKNTLTHNLNTKVLKVLLKLGWLIISIYL